MLPKTINFKIKKIILNILQKLLLPQLETGTYLVYFESDSDLKEKKAFAYETITVSNIKYSGLSRKSTKKIFRFWIRKTGKPLENVTIKSKRYTLKTDSNGLASYIGENNNDYNDHIEFSLANDTILIEKIIFDIRQRIQSNRKQCFNRKS